VQFNSIEAGDTLSLRSEWQGAPPAFSLGRGVLIKIHKYYIA